MIGLYIRDRSSIAVDHLRLIRMKFQPTFPQPCGYGCPNLLGFGFRSAMRDDIVGVSFKRHLWVPLRHPSIKCVMQSQIG